MFKCTCMFHWRSRLFIRPHRCTAHADAVYCYRRSNAVCRSVCLSRSWALQKPLYRSRSCFMAALCNRAGHYIFVGLWTWVGLRNRVLDGVHIGATWRIRLNRPCAAAMRPFCQIIILTSCSFYIFFSNFVNSIPILALFRYCHQQQYFVDIEKNVPRRRSCDLTIQ